MMKSKVNDEMCRMFRGGAWGYFPWLLRSAHRYWFVPVYRSNYLGFRILTQPDAHHIIKGGSWARMALDLRSPNRDGHEPAFLSGTMGFRIAMESGQ